MHPSIDQFLCTLTERRRSPLTLKAVRHDLIQFATWWETTFQCRFDPAVLLESDVRDWRIARQRDDGARPATINRALSSLRSYCAWACAAGVLVENPATAVPDVPTPALAPRSLAPEAVDALRRAGREDRNPIRRVRDEAILALLIYAGLRVQEICDVQLRDVDVAGGTVTVRSGKAGKARRVPLHVDAQTALQRYLDTLRCPAGTPAVGSREEREPLVIGIEVTAAGRPLRPGIAQRVVQRTVKRLGQQAAQRLRAEAVREPSVERIARLDAWAYQLETVTPHRLRHSLARRMLKNGAQLSEVQRILGHTRLSTTGVYLMPSEDDLREAINRGGLQRP